MASTPILRFLYVLFGAFDVVCVFIIEVNKFFFLFLSILVGFQASVALPVINGSVSSHMDTGTGHVWMLC